MAGPLVFFAIVIAFFGVILWSSAQTQKTKAENLRVYADHRLQDGTCSVPEGLFGPKFDGAVVRGRRQGRRVKLRIELRGSGDNAVTYGVYSVEVPNAVTSFEISKAGVMRRFGRWLGVVNDATLGEERLDEKYVVRLGGKRVGRLFHCGEMERLLDHLFQGLGFGSVSLKAGLLQVDGTFGMSSMSPTDLDRVFALLEKMARLCERRQIDIKLTDAKVTRRYGWTDGGHDVLCPYCRDTIGLDGGGEPVSACEQCDTVHHTACLREAGGCVVFGCRGAGSKHAA